MDNNEINNNEVFNDMNNNMNNDINNVLDNYVNDNSNNDNNVNNVTDNKSKKEPLVYNKIHYVDVLILLFFLLGVFIYKYGAEDSISTALKIITLFGYEGVILYYYIFEYSRFNHKSYLISIIDVLLAFATLCFYPYPIGFFIYTFNGYVYFMLGIFYSIIPTLHCYFDKIRLNFAIVLKVLTRVLMILFVIAMVASLSSCAPNIG